MKLTKRRVLGGLAATGVLAGTLAGGGVALASNGSGNAATAATAATSAPGQCDGWAGLHNGIGGIRAGQTLMTAAADYLGITQAQLAAKLQAGQSLADVAKAQDKPVTGLKNALIAAFTSQVNASSKLTAAQKAELISEAKSHIDTFVTMTHPAGAGPHWGGGPAHDDSTMPGGMHGMYREAVFGA